MNNNDMLIIKKDVPKFLFKILMKIYKFKIINNNEMVTSYQKNLYSKDMNNYAVINEIHIFENREFDFIEICVVPHYLIDDMYDWYNGIQARNKLKLIFPKILKYTEIKSC